MKRYIITLVLAVGLGFNLSAQNDGFFTYSNYDNRQDSEWGEMPGLPHSYGLTDNQSAPLGSGFLILGGLALGYAVRKKNRNPDLS